MTKSNKIIILLLSLVLILAALIAGSSIPMTPHVGAVVLTENDFDHTKIEDDLADTDLTEYPKDPNGTPVVIGVIEYCYTENMFKQGNYGIYFYVYNPAQTAYSTDEGANVVNMATEYGAEGEPTNYENMPLTYLNKSTGDYAELFYKFKVTDASRLLTQAMAYSNDHGERRYDIAGLQLREIAGKVKDYEVESTYRYTGYAKGYNHESKDESTLTCERNEFETLRLNVNHTFYRPEGSNGSGQNRDCLSSVYFSVPNRVKDKYGKLYSIKAEWLKAVTDWIFVTGNSQVYQGILPYIGKTVGSFNWDLVYGFGNLAATSAETFYNYAYNNFAYPTEKDNLIDPLYYIFQSETVNAHRYNVSNEELLQYMLSYTESHSTPKVLNKYSADLFESYASDKTVAEITADDTFTLTSGKLGSSFWSNWFGKADVTTYEGIEAIHEVVDDDFVSDDQVNCDKLYIDVSDYTEFVTFYGEAKAKNETVYLFRFAVDDYLSFLTNQWKGVLMPLGVPYNMPIGGESYLAKETVYLDFDIIYLKYANDGNYHIIPVVMDPIDVIGDITHPIIGGDAGCNGLPLWLVIVIIVVCCLLLLPLIIALLPQIIKLVAFLVKWLFKIVWWIISAPFRFVAWIVKKVQERPKTPKEPKTKNRGQQAAPRAKTKTVSKRK